MNGLLTYAELGFRHITNLAALDHLLFLLALAAPYRAADWRKLVAVASAFTVGHSITLAVAVSGVVALPTTLIEFLIPVTIAITAFRNILSRGAGRFRWEPVLAALFGLIHGAGFANYLTALFDGPVGVPLLGFNLGIEAGQIIILSGYIVAFEIAARWLGRADAWRHLAVRRIGISAGAGAWALLMAFERLPR